LRAARLLASVAEGIRAAVREHHVMPVFLIGTPHSGAHLLRAMLSRLPGIAAPHPPHILMRFMPLLPQYADLRKPENLTQLVDDVCRLVELDPVPWEGVVLNRMEVLKRCRAPSLVAVFGAVYDLCASAWKMDTWCCQSLQNIRHLPEIDSYFVDARYIYLHRDGRDVACSFRRAVLGEKHFYHIAREWGETQRLALAHRERISTERFLSLSYEELTGTPEQALRRLCWFLGVDFVNEMLDVHLPDVAQRAAAPNDDAPKTPHGDNVRQFLREATAEDIRVFESVAGDVLDALGYTRACVSPGRERRFSRAELESFDIANRMLKDGIHQLAGSAVRHRRDRQGALLTEIRARGTSDSPPLWIGSGQSVAFTRPGSAL
jgi:hypothetical protein